MSSAASDVDVRQTFSCPSLDASAEVSSSVEISALSL